MLTESVPLRRPRVCLGLMLVLLCGSAGGGGGGGDIWVYVDNGGSKPMVVSVDGKEAATIPAGKFAKLECPAGERKLRVESGGSVLYTGTKDLKASEKFLVGRRYFFNPDSHHRYLVYTVKYGSSPFEGVLKSALVGSPSDRDSALRMAHRELEMLFKLMPASSWFEVPDRALVLQPPPEYVTTKGYSATRTVLTRVEGKDYDFLEAARNKAKPSESDVRALADVLKKVMSE